MQDHDYQSEPAGHAQVSLTRSAIQATLHCLTGCAIGEVLGMVFATALGWSNAASIAVLVVLAFFFGYSLTLWPVRARTRRRARVARALAHLAAEAGEDRPRERPSPLAHAG